MVSQGPKLILDRCIHCQTKNPNLGEIGSSFTTRSFDELNPRSWRSYVCSTCGGVILTAARNGTINIIEMYPADSSLENEIPERAREYLRQAIDCLSSPAGSVMLAASSIDAMLKSKNLKEGSLYNRIEKATASHLITEEMATWAHEVRLDANDQRHADESAPLPDLEDAKRVIEFAKALATFLFVLPARVQRGIENTEH